MSSDNRMYCYVCITSITNEVKLFWYKKDAEKWKKEHVDPTARFKKLVIA
jgi:hypothetical protein